MKKLALFLLVAVSFCSKAQVSICAGSTTTLTATNPSVLTGPSYSMQPGGFSSPGGTFVISPGVTSSYSLYTTGQNTNNITVTSLTVITVTVNPQPLAAPSLTQSSCQSTVNAFNLNLTFNPSTPVPGYTVTWLSIPPGITSPSQTTLTGVPVGTHNATIVATGGCSVATSFTMLSQPAPATFSVLPLGNSHTLTCTQTTLELIVSNTANSYTWTSTSTPPQTGTAVTLSASSVGNWTVYGVNPTSSCSATFSFAVTQNTQAPSAVIGPTLQAITCTMTTPGTFSASANPSVNIKHEIYTPFGPLPYTALSHTMVYIPSKGTYTYVLTNLINGCSITQNFTVTSIDGFPTFTLVPSQNYTIGCTTTSVETINIADAEGGTGPGSPVTYTILSSSSPTNYGTSTNPTFTFNLPGTYTVVVRDVGNGCETKVPIAITQNTMGPQVSIAAPQTILDCVTTSVTLKGSTTTEGVFEANFNWSFQGVPGNELGSTKLVETNPLDPEEILINSYTLTITNPVSTCKSTSVVAIYQNLFPPITRFSIGTGSLTCFTPTLYLTNTSTTSIPNSTGFPNNLPPVAYLWQGPSPQSPLQLSSTYLAATAGPYTLTSRDPNNGCMSSTVITVGDARVYPILNNPAAPPPSILDCGAVSTKLSPIISNPIAGATYTWSMPATITPTVVGVNTATLTTNMPGSYTIEVLYTNGCSSKVAMAVENGSLTPEVAVSKEFGYAPLEVEFYNNSRSSTGNSSITATWGFGNGTFISTPSASIIPKTVYNSAGTYTVAAFISKGACIDTVYKVITVEIPSGLVVPNVFTPNGDGINDLFFLKSTNLTQITALIYDRWGNKVYDLVSEKGNIAWDGKNQAGKELPEGTYFYIIKATGKDGQTYDTKGTVSLLR